eukprot:927563-Pelagomonas_calceolata.AAC.2
MHLFSHPVSDWACPEILACCTLAYLTALQHLVIHHALDSSSSDKCACLLEAYYMGACAFWKGMFAKLCLADVRIAPKALHIESGTDEAFQTLITYVEYLSGQH